ncbi:MAG TPA: hypothetical protein GXX19_00450 [Syntrophomonadaceae bacterium]|nr:hypothetical protein [Syntrophomonadaceae bacterium]
MIEYLVVLAIITSIITMACRHFQKYLPINIRVVYITIGVSFILSAIFPLALALFKISFVLLIYFVLFLMLAFVLSWIQDRFVFERPAAGEPFQEILSANVAHGAELKTNLKEKKSNAVPETPGQEEAAGPALPDEIFPGVRQSGPVSVAAEVLPEPAVYAPPAAEERQDTEIFPGLAEEGLAAPAPPLINPPEEEKFAGAEIPTVVEPEQEQPVEALPTGEAVFEGAAEETAVPAVCPEKTGLPAVIGEAVGVGPGGMIGLPRDPAAASSGEDGEAYPGTLEMMDEITGLWEDHAGAAGASESVAGDSPAEKVGVTEDQPLVAGEQKNDGAVLSVVSDGGGAGEETVPEPAVIADEEEQVRSEVVSTVDNYIARGFAARETGNYVDAVDCFLKALLSNPGEQLKALLALEISAVYQQLGQYRQAVMLLDAMLAPGSGIRDRTLRQQLYARKVNLEVTAELLKTARQPNTPYAAIPSLIKVKAGVETAERLKSKRKGKVN